MEYKDKLLNFKNQLVNYITKTFFRNEQLYFSFLETKSVLTVLTEISSLSHRFAISNDEKLKKLLTKQCIILVFQLNVILEYSEILKKLGIGYDKINLDEPTMYAPIKITDTDINIADTLGKMCCNLSMGLWNDFSDKNYSTSTVVQRISNIQEESFGLFLIELELYLLAFISTQSNDLINSALERAFVIINKAKRIASILDSRKEKTTTTKPIQTTEKPKVTIIEQPVVVNSKTEEPVEKPKPTRITKKKEDAPKKEETEITLKESHINQDGELEESNIKTTIIN